MKPSQQSISVLVVEDEKVVREVMDIMISMKFPDVAVYSAENGKMGLELFKEHTPEIVITDIQMPIMDGIEMAGNINSIKNGTRFIVLTAFSHTEYYEKFSEIGFLEFQQKPIEFDKLFAAIEKCVAEITNERQ
jgi:YesN/AraC family two-component response regulator